MSDLLTGHAVRWAHDTLELVNPDKFPCENPFAFAEENPMKKTIRSPETFTCTCRKCGKQVPMAGNGPRDHLQRCRPEAARAIDREYRGRIRALAVPAAEGMRAA